MKKWLLLRYSTLQPGNSFLNWLKKSESDRFCCLSTAQHSTQEEMLTKVSWLKMNSGAHHWFPKALYKQKHLFKFAPVCSSLLAYVSCQYFEQIFLLKWVLLCCPPFFFLQLSNLFSVMNRFVEDPDADTRLVLKNNNPLLGVQKEGKQGELQWRKKNSD